MVDVTVLPAASAGQHLAGLRDETTQPEDFRRHATVLGTLLAAQAIHDIPLASGSVTTPLGPAPSQVPAPGIVVVPVLRAGLGLLAGVQSVLPRAIVGMVGLARDHETHAPIEYYRRVPDVSGAWVLLLEPMLATGGSAAAAVAGMATAGASKVCVLSVVGTRTAIDRIAAETPDVRIVAAAIDPELDENAYIVPGLGDFGDRLYGTHF